MANGFTFRSRDASVDCIWQRCFVPFLCLRLARVLLLLQLLLVALLCLLTLLVALKLLLCLLGLIDRRALRGGPGIGGDQRRCAASSPGGVAQSALRLRLRRCILPDPRLLLAC